MSLYPPFFKIGEHCKSKDKDNPDILEIEFLELETFETDYGIHINTKINGKEYAFTLKNFNQNNNEVLRIWNEGKRKEKWKLGKKYKFATWLQPLKKNKGWNYRKWELL